jgi:hypothetical protein
MRSLLVKTTWNIELIKKFQVIIIYFRGAKNSVVNKPSIYLTFLSFYSYFKIHLNNILHLRLISQVFSFLSGVMTKILRVFLISTVRATCHAYLIFLHVITLIIFGEVLKIVLFPGFSYYLRLLRCKNSPQHPNLTHPQFMFYPQRPSHTDT